MLLLYFQIPRTVTVLIIFLIAYLPLSGQQLLSPAAVPKFVNPLPLVRPVPGPGVIDARAGGNPLEISITQIEQDLGLGLGVKTKVWGYNGQYPGPTIVARKNVPVQVYWLNQLTTGNNGTGAYLPHLLPVDVSIHWALRDYIDEEDIDDWETELGVPIVTHLHGGHTESASDGLPEAWYTPNGAVVGPHYVKGSNIPYRYDNDQEAATLWYHDHALGITRLNVYAGLAGFYLLTDDNEQDLKARNILPADEYDIGLAIQDRMFTTDGQLFYPSEAEGEMHGMEMDDAPEPSILPEFFGDIILVNGKAWPKLEVEPREYRFRLLNGSDSRFYNLKLTEEVKIWQVGSDNGLLQVPVKQTEILIAPGERKDIVIDFSDPALWGKQIIFTNDANIPFPDGDPVGEGASQIMAFEVTKSLNTNYSLSKVRGLLAKGLQPVPTEINTKNLKVRKLILFEGEDEYGRLKPMLGTFEEGALDWHEPITENPALNATEVWEIYNLTPDSHPIHLHLVSFRAINSQKFVPVYGSPEDEAIGKLSGVNFTSVPLRPERGQQGRKDTYPIAPGEVTRLIATFDRPGRYVWHCHILSHEDHEMMRPYYVGAMPANMVASHSQQVKKASEVAFENGAYQVYPNPFSTAATVQLDIKETVAVAVRLIDLSGRVVREVPSKQLSVGSHKLEIFAEDMQSGMYICEVEVNNKLHRSRLVLAR
ncbi:multicopper oxidase domain-containing protein [Pontibacter cellulosilyticus]|uniref:Multicopper oxidase domain-containing protein n=1 Tax=Pontibacter cellulosilyticus TaxID=1720253 RepID=A0A923NBR4_9BACT|nr:multicopper oxidase domain-containing protein [Pontibacter cellulosilyticus]MBC5994996.1 multicopper oxidase domain-containing protein [Pontibacter cellulosilyticus]